MEREVVPGYFAPGYLSRSEKLEARRAEFARLIQEFARAHRQHCITARERAKCDDIIRGQSLSLSGLELLVDLAARSETPLAFEELIRGEVLRRLAAPALPCPFEASHAEQASNEPLNAAQLLAHQEKTPVRWWQVVETATEQLRATRTLLDAAQVHVGRLV